MGEPHGAASGDAAYNIRLFAACRAVDSAKAGLFAVHPEVFDSRCTIHGTAAALGLRISLPNQYGSATPLR
jgi:hypothetical protein